MIGRQVRTAWGERGHVTRWEPLGVALCDVLVQHTDGRLCWHASSSLRPTDDLGPLPDRRLAHQAARAQANMDLRAIRADLAKSIHEPWTGANFGKGIVGIALDRALRA